MDTRPEVENREIVQTVAERRFLVLAREWREEVGKIPDEHCLSAQADTLAKACLLLAVEWGAGFTDVARSEMEVNRAAAETRRQPAWLDEMPWRLCLVANIPLPVAEVPAVWELTTNLDHQNSSIRCWMMELGWIAAPWMNPVEATVRLLKNLADTLSGPFTAAGLAARFFDKKPEGFFDFAKSFKPPEGFEEQYQARLKTVEEQGTWAAQAGLWRTEALCRKEIERTALGWRLRKRIDQKA